jgi:asparagine synthase (glutamine-hydrolysing)
MCGIYGITENNPKIIKEIIKKCSYRGPNASGIYSSEKLTLGHNLLSITSKPKEGKQPWKSINENILIYNGEIFNYDELLIRFKDRFYPKSTCDTELLSWLLDEFSYEQVIQNTIDSMHSFVFYNKKKNEIVLSRDHVGIKPLFFSNIKAGIIFSSEIKGLLDYVKNSNKIDRLSLACTSMLGVNVMRQTVFNGINKVLPGETIVYDLALKKIKKSFRTLIKPTSNNKFVAEEFNNITSKIITNSTLGLRKFGVFLSGGIDSSLIAYELNKHINNLNTFTNIMEPNVIINGEDHNSDACVAKEFADNSGFNHKEIKITPEIIAKEWDNANWTIEEPRYNWNLPMYYYTNKYLSKNNIVVTMAGDIGDEIFGGYKQYVNMKKMISKPKTWRDFLKMWSKKFAAPIKLNIKFNQNDLIDVLEKTLPEEIWNPDDIANSAMALDCITTVSEDFFSRNDRYGMAFSMEGRFPLASKEYMKYCLSINSDYKFGNNYNTTKLPVRVSYENKIPNYIFDKYKTGWSVPITNWLQTSNIIKNKYLKTVNTDDGIKEILDMQNYSGNIKRAIITWMIRTWAQQYNMNL